MRFIKREGRPESVKPDVDLPVDGMKKKCVQVPLFLLQWRLLVTISRSSA